MKSLQHPLVDAFFALTADLCCIATPDGNLLSVNPAWSRVLGDAGADPASSLPGVFHPEDRARARAALAELSAGPAQASFEARAIGCDASVRWLRVQAVRRKGEPYLCLAATDVTQLKLAEEQHRDDMLVHHQILDAITDMVLVKGPKSRIVWANKAFRDLYGMTAEQVHDMIDAPFAEPDNTLQYIKDDAYVFTSGEVLDIPSEPVTRHDGVVRQFHTVKSPLRNERGEIVLTVGVSHDITERKLWEHQSGVIERQNEVIHAMATPILEIWNGVLAMPLIGVVDSTRAATMTEDLLQTIVRTRSPFTIVDLTGVDAADTATTNHLFKLVQAAGLLGTTCVVSGISPSVAMTMVSMGTDIGSLRTFGTLRSALWYVLQKLNVGLVQKPGSASPA